MVMVWSFMFVRVRFGLGSALAPEITCLVYTFEDALHEIRGIGVIRFDDAMIVGSRVARLVIHLGLRVGTLNLSGRLGQISVKAGICVRGGVVGVEICCCSVDDYGHFQVRLILL